METLTEEQRAALAELINRADEAAALLTAIPGGELRAAIFHAITRVRKAFADGKREAGPIG